MDPIDKSRCSFPVPDFASEDDEQAWSLTLTPTQRMELLYLAQVARWGEQAMNRPMDRTHMDVLTSEEFNRMKEAENAAEEEWRRANGWRIRRYRGAPGGAPEADPVE